MNSKTPRILLVGSGSLSERQVKILEKHFGNYTIVKHIPMLLREDLKRIKRTGECGGSEDEICVDVAVFFKAFSLAAELLKKGIEVYDFEVARSPSGNGDLHGGVGLTIGLRKYGLSIKPVARWVYVE
jgi:hypothetical protein